MDPCHLRTNPGSGEHQAQIAELIALGKLVYSPEGFALFLTSRMPVFDDFTALELIERGDVDRVFSAVIQDYEGLGF